MTDDGYTWTVPDWPIVFDVSRIRRESQELIGELSVKCFLPGASVISDHILSIADMNFSSLRARKERAGFLQNRAHTNGECDWVGLVENFSQQLIRQERQGDPSVDLRTVQRPPHDDDVRVDGLVMPRRHATILFGDGGAAKSLTALYVAGKLAKRDLAIAFFDWELDAEDHRDRLECLFGPGMPVIHYAKCDRPLVYEVDRLRRIVADHHVDFAVYDSIAVACDGPPESAEIAGKYFRAVRQIGCGSLHNAHINRSEHSDQKPFGSTFWHNLARSTWFVQALEELPAVRLGFFNRKRNLGALCRPFSYVVSFGPEGTRFEMVDVGESEELCLKMTIRQRLAELLKHGSMTVDEVAAKLDVKKDSIYKVVDRGKSRQFILLGGGRVGLHA